MQRPGLGAWVCEMSSVTGAARLHAAWKWEAGTETHPEHMGFRVLLLT